MCLAVPVRIERIVDDASAEVSLEGVTTRVSTQLIDSPQVGDFIIIHVGHALEKLDPEEAKATLELIRQGEQE